MRAKLIDHHGNAVVEFAPIEFEQGTRSLEWSKNKGQRITVFGVEIDDDDGCHWTIESPATLYQGDFYQITIPADPLTDDEISALVGLCRFAEPSALEEAAESVRQIIRLANDHREDSAMSNALDRARKAL